MLAKTPADRFDTMADALAALEAHPLTERDPAHADLRRLAIPSTAVRVAASIGPSVSPIPRVGPRIGQLTISNGPDIVVAGDQFELRAMVRSDSGATLSGRVVRHRPRQQRDNDSPALDGADRQLAPRLPRASLIDGPPRAAAAR
jgi:hypothetical protein